MLFSPADYLLWSRCRRQWRDRCAAEGVRVPALPREMTGEATLRETARVIEIGISAAGEQGHRKTFNVAVEILRPEEGPPIGALPVLVLESDRFAAWDRATRDALTDVSEGEAPRPAISHAVLVCQGQAVLIDLLEWHPKLTGWHATLFRPGTGLRGVYADEVALVAWVMERTGFPLVQLDLAYLDKGYRAVPDRGSDLSAGFRRSNMVGRARKRISTVERERLGVPDSLEELVIEEGYRCSQGCRLCVPRHRDTGLTSVYTLHKGGQLADELVRGGITDIRELDPGTRRISARQRIQIEAVRTGVPYVDPDRLRCFLDQLRYPLHFLDFEAYAPSWPEFRGIAPYEHLPVIASVHTRSSPDAAVEQEVFAAEPGRDQRGELFDWLENQFGTFGSIVVFSKPFESAMVRQMATLVDREGEGTAIVDRMIDLLTPFADFLVYHPEQRGKVSLKRVLPVYTDAHYDDSPLKDGMHANLAYTRHADRARIRDGEAPEAIVAAARAAEGASTILDRAGSGAARLVPVEDVATYCGVDTMALVHLVEELCRIAEEATAVTSRRQDT